MDHKNEIRLDLMELQSLSTNSDNKDVRLMALTTRKIVREIIKWIDSIENK